MTPEEESYCLKYYRERAEYWRRKAKEYKIEIQKLRKMLELLGGDE